MKKLIQYILAVSVCFTMACDPVEEDKITLPPPPSSVSFEINDLGNNQYHLINSTPETFIHQWDLGNGSFAEGEDVMVQYPTAGVYIVTLKAFNAGGSGSSSKEIVVEEDIEVDCGSDIIFEKLTNCESRTWTLDDGEAALYVGPNEFESWWFNTLDDQATRVCHWDDEWIFTKDLEMIYDAKGQVWAEPYMGFDFECIDESQLPPGLETWGSGTHGFVLEPGNPYKLTVSGLGAFIGMPKAINGAEVDTPVSSITYDILEIYQDGAKEIMLLEVNIGAGIWRYRLKSE